MHEVHHAVGRRSRFPAPVSEQNEPRSVRAEGLRAIFAPRRARAPARRTGPTRSRPLSNRPRSTPRGRASPRRSTARRPTAPSTARTSRRARRRTSPTCAGAARWRNTARRRTGERSLGGGRDVHDVVSVIGRGRDPPAAGVTQMVLLALLEPPHETRVRVAHRLNDAPPRAARTLRRFSRKASARISFSRCMRSSSPPPFGQLRLQQELDQSRARWLRISSMAMSSPRSSPRSCISSSSVPASDAPSTYTPMRRTARFAS